MRKVVGAPSESSRAQRPSESLCTCVPGGRRPSAPSYRTLGCQSPSGRVSWTAAVTSSGITSAWKRCRTASSTDAIMSLGSQIRVGVCRPSCALSWLYAFTVMPDAFIAPRSIGARSVSWKLTVRRTRSLEVMAAIVLSFPILSAPHSARSPSPPQDRGACRVERHHAFPRCCDEMILQRSLGARRVTTAQRRQQAGVLLGVSGRCMISVCR